MFTLPSPFLSEALTHTLQPVRPAPSVLARTLARVEAGGPRHVAGLRQDSELVLMAPVLVDWAVWNAVFCC